MRSTTRSWAGVVTVAGLSMVPVLVGFSTAHVVYAICDSDRALTRSGASTRSDSTYADGEFTATGWYGGLPSSITVTVRLTNGIITAVKVVPHATDPTSLDLQRRFAAAVPAVVVGKRIDQVKVGKLAGSSGTPQGFNDAIRRITEEARRARRQQRAET